MQQIRNFIQDKSSEIIAFVSGDLLTTTAVYIFGNQYDWLHPIIKIIGAFVVGFFGGIGGLIAKDVFDLLKKKTWRK